MSISRISTSYTINQAISQTQSNRLATMGLQQNIASGRNFEYASDNPISYSKLLKLNLEMQKDETYKRNIQNGLIEMGTADVAVQGIVDITHRARELAVQASNGTNNAESLDAIAKEIDALMKQLVQFGNTSISGRYIFSGFATDTPPFAINGDDINYNGTPLTSPHDRDVKISEDSSVSININGDSLLGQVSVDPGPPPVASGNGLFYALTKLKLDLESNDFEAIRQDIDLVTTQQKAVLKLQTYVGNQTSQLELAQNRLEDRKLAQSKAFSEINDLDLAEAITKLSAQQNAYETSLMAMVRIMNTSLVNFMG